MKDAYDEPSVPEGFEDIEKAADAALPEAEVTDDSLVASTPVITGGEGFGTVRRRNLLALVELPQYLVSTEHPERGIDYVAQGYALDGDIREAMAKAARKLHDTAMKYSVTGYEWDLDDIQYDMPQSRTLSATLVIERG